MYMKIKTSTFSFRPLPILDRLQLTLYDLKRVRQPTLQERGITATPDHLPKNVWRKYPLDGPEGDPGQRFSMGTVPQNHKQKSERSNSRFKPKQRVIHSKPIANRYIKPLSVQNIAVRRAMKAP